MLSPTRKPIRKRAAISSQAAGQTGRMPLSPPAEPDPQRPAEEVEERRVLERDRDADFGPVEEEVGDAEAEQDEQVEVGDPPAAPPVDQPEQEERAERQEDVGGVELVAEGAGVAARHLPGDLVAGPGLADARRWPGRRRPAPPPCRRRSSRPPSCRRPSSALWRQRPGCSSPLLRSTFGSRSAIRSRLRSR